MPEEATSTEPVVEAPEGTPEAAEVAAVETPDVNEPFVPESYTVKVGGQEIEVTLEEALRGYQRQADYTQKTQALAQEREQLSHAERLWNEIEANPEGTLRKIAAAYGISLGEARQAVADAQAADDPFAQAFGDGEPQTRSEDPRWEQVQQFMQETQQQQAVAQVQAEIAAVQRTYGVANLDGQALVQYAIDNGIDNLDAAFRAMSFEAVMQQAGRGRKQQAKAEAPPVAGGHGVPAGAFVPGSGSQFPSIEEAAMMAEQQLQSS